MSGAASGIGLGIATALAKAGANVVLADIRKNDVEDSAHRLAQDGANVIAIAIDVTQEDSVASALVQSERKFARLHIACNNAGVPMHGVSLTDVLHDDWAFVLAVNVWGIINGIRHFVPGILKHGEEGHVVNTASVAGFQYRRAAKQGPYSTTKFAAVAMSEALQFELEGSQVGVSVLCPGPIKTDLARGARNRPDHLGGPQTRPTDEALLADRLATIGIDSMRAGERALDAIRTNTFYAFVGAVPADAIRARHRRIEAALESPWVTYF